MNNLKRVAVLCASIVSFSALYALLFFGLTLLPEMWLWRNTEISVPIFTYQVNLFSALHFIIGMVFFIYGSCALNDISAENHAARDTKTRTPVRLLTTGYYARVRHPMYGTFMLLQMSVLFSLRSVYGIIFIVLAMAIQYVNSMIEERQQLTKLFGTEYEEYKRRVRCRLLTPPMKACFVIAGVFSIVGIVFRYV